MGISTLIFLSTIFVHETLSGRTKLLNDITKMNLKWLQERNFELNSVEYNSLPVHLLKFILNQNAVDENVVQSKTSQSILPVDFSRKLSDFVADHFTTESDECTEPTESVPTDQISTESTLSSTFTTETTTDIINTQTTSSTEEQSTNSTESTISSTTTVPFTNSTESSTSLETKSTENSTDTTISKYFTNSTNSPTIITSVSPIDPDVPNEPVFPSSGGLKTFTTQQFVLLISCCFPLLM